MESVPSLVSHSDYTPYWPIMGRHEVIHKTRST